MIPLEWLAAAALLGGTGVTLWWASRQIGPPGSDGDPPAPPRRVGPERQEEDTELPTGPPPPRPSTRDLDLSGETILPGSEPRAGSGLPTFGGATPGAATGAGGPTSLRPGPPPSRPPGPAPGNPLPGLGRPAQTPAASPLVESAFPGPEDFPATGSTALIEWLGVPQPVGEELAVPDAPAVGLGSLPLLSERPADSPPSTPGRAAALPRGVEVSGWALPRASEAPVLAPLQSPAPVGVPPLVGSLPPVAGTLAAPGPDPSAGAQEVERLEAPEAEGSAGFLVSALLSSGGGAATGWTIAAMLGLSASDRSSVALGAGVAGLVLAVARDFRQRRRSVSDGLPDALDLMGTCIAAGLGSGEALRRTAAAMLRANPPLGRALSEATAAWNVGEDRGRLAERMGRRAGLGHLAEALTALDQAERLGGQASTTLAHLALELRSRRRAAIAAWASRLPLLVAVSVLVFFVPPLMTFLLGPSVLDLLDLSL